ncbi:MAG TPA: TraM recognition domain-containing protein, partial [Pyrinomonadaceae bacterium]|nr:TraM recognition domain-containing protein [Pyrinomonadaceae bacterium]
GLGYQDLPQMYDQYGRERANAILGTVMTKIFLPGLDDVTAEYASKQLGDTTIFSKTFQDYPGKKNDNTRYAEQRRALMHASETRQIARHSEVLIISDTAPPIRAAYPFFAVLKSVYLAKQKGSPQELHLGDIDPAFLLTEPPKAVTKPNAEQQWVADLISNEVERIYSDEKLIGAVERMTKPALPRFGAEEAESKRSYATKLDDLVGDIRLLLANRYEQKPQIMREAV